MLVLIRLKDNIFSAYAAQFTLIFSPGVGEFVYFLLSEGRRVSKSAWLHSVRGLHSNRIMPILRRPAFDNNLNLIHFSDHIQHILVKEPTVETRGL